MDRVVRRVTVLAGGAGPDNRVDRFLDVAVEADPGGEVTIRFVKPIPVWVRDAMLKTGAVQVLIFHESLQVPADAQQFPTGRSADGCSR